jgi:hypothetical protein
VGDQACAHNRIPVGNGECNGEKKCFFRH